MKRNVIRIGDTVKVIESKFIKRVGYPLIWTDLLEEVTKDPRTAKAWDILTQPHEPIAATKPSLEGGLLFEAHGEPEFPKDFLRIIAQRRVEERSYGGDLRSLHYYKLEPPNDNIKAGSQDALPDYTGRVFEVIGKKLAKTGVRVAPTSGRSGYWEPEDWYDPGGLEDCKTHILLNTAVGWIEATNVELIKRAPGSTDRYPATSKYVSKLS